MEPYQSANRLHSHIKLISRKIEPYKILLIYAGLLQTLFAYQFSN
jgi:hypothetical protein